MRTAPGVSVAGPAAADDLSASPLLAYVDAGELTPAEYDELVYALEADSDVFTPVVEPAASLTGGTE
jgi:hypothetical protein